VAGQVPPPLLYKGLGGRLSPSPSPRSAAKRGKFGGGVPLPSRKDALGFACPWPAWPSRPGAPSPLGQDVLPQVRAGPRSRGPTSGPTPEPFRIIHTIPKNSKTFSEPLSYDALYKSYSPEHSGTPRNVMVLI
jgi:hypothetical protein